MPAWLTATFWGGFAGSALLLGAALGYYTTFSPRTIAGVMGFGSGVLISALSFELMDKAYRQGGADSTSIGFLAGALVYSIANWRLAALGAKHRKRSAGQPAEEDHEGSGSAIALGALLDGIPESIVIGLTLLAGGAVSRVAVAAIFLSNIPEGLSSAAGMKAAGRSAAYVFGLWAAVAAASALAALAGYSVFGGFSTEVVAGTTAVAAGGILAMIVDTMIPEASHGTHQFAGLIAVVGFLFAFVLGKLGE
jgi:ZIP family zinc transporter